MKSTSYSLATLFAVVTLACFVMSIATDFWSDDPSQLTLEVNTLPFHAGDQTHDAVMAPSVPEFLPDTSFMGRLAEQLLHKYGIKTHSLELRSSKRSETVKVELYGEHEPSETRISCTLRFTPSSHGELVASIRPQEIGLPESDEMELRIPHE